jgi:hypothetical protein
MERRKKRKKRRMGFENRKYKFLMPVKPIGQQIYT